MTISVSCKCGKQYRVQDDYAGRTAKCASCNRAMVVPRTRKPRRAKKAIKNSEEMMRGLQKAAEYVMFEEAMEMMPVNSAFSALWGLINICLGVFLSQHNSLNHFLTFVGSILVVEAVLGIARPRPMIFLIDGISTIVVGVFNGLMGIMSSADGLDFSVVLFQKVAAIQVLSGVWGVRNYAVSRKFDRTPPPQHLLDQVLQWKTKLEDDSQSTNAESNPRLFQVNIGDLGGVTQVLGILIGDVGVAITQRPMFRVNEFYIFGPTDLSLRPTGGTVEGELDVELRLRSESLGRDGLARMTEEHISRLVRWRQDFQTWNPTSETAHRDGVPQRSRTTLSTGK